MKSFVVVLLAVAASAFMAAAQPTSTAPSAAPSVQTALDTPASLQAKRLLQAALSDDEAGFRRLVLEVYPAADFATAEWNEMRGHLRTLRFHGVIAATATHAELSVFNTDMDHWMRIVVDVDAAEPHKITAFTLHMSGGRPADVPATPKLPPEQLIAATRAMLDAQVAADGFSGAVLIADHGKPLFAAAYGLADRETRAPNTVTTQFHFGSVGKLFTAVAVMQLAQAGKIDLTAPVGRYLADYPNPDIAAKVTVNELLTHAGGTGDIFGPDFDAHRDSLREPKDYIALYGARPPLFPPGSRQDYSNYGFVILGRIVERVSGLAYDDYIQRNIFAPARMRSTGMQPNDLAAPGRATGYMTIEGELRPATAAALRRLGARTDGYLEYRGGPAGGGYSTVGDFLRFANALMSNRLLDSEHTRLLTTGQVTLPNGAAAYYDFGGPTDDGRRFIGHGGSAPGQSAEFRIYPDDYTVVVLSNRDFPMAMHVMGFIGERLP